jgi:tagatose 1,6-diphosphate aldolase
LAIEKSGYEGNPTARRTELLDNWSVEQARKAGATGIKLLVYYRAEAPNAAEQEELVATVSRECHRWDLPLFLEPLHYSLDPNAKTVPSDERRRTVIESARRLTPLGVDILKAEFPVDVMQTEDRDEWADACAELSDSCPVPWVLLSAGVDFATYVDQVRTACTNGASGILCGRAVWKESVQMTKEERMRFLGTTAADRFRLLGEIVADTARPYTDFYPGTSGDELEKWYLNSP